MAHADDHAAGYYEATPDHMSAMDYAAHETTYRHFLGLVKWGIIFCVVLLALMGFFLT